MSISTQCPSCNRRFAAPDHLLGKSAKCPQCSNQFTVQPVAGGPAPARLSASGTAPRPEPEAAETPRRRSSTKPVLIAVGVLLFAAVAAAGYFFLAGGDWKEFASKDGGFKVLLPGDPAPKGKTDARIAGANMQEIVQPSRSSTYSIHYYDLPYKPINDHLYFSFLKHVLLAEKSGSKATRDLDLKLDSHAGKEIVLELPDDQVLARRVYLANARVFWVTAQYPKAVTHPTEAQRFFDSFKITNVPPAPAATVASVSSGAAPALKPNISFDTPITPDPPTTKTDPKINPPLTKAGFPINPDEQTLVDLINRFRATEKLAPLTPEKRLFDGARSEAASQARREATKQTDYGYSRIFRLTLPGRDETPQEILDNLLRLKPFRQQLADADFIDIGVGIGKGKDGITYYLIILGGRFAGE